MTKLWWFALAINALGVIWNGSLVIVGSKYPVLTGMCAVMNLVALWLLTKHAPGKSVSR